MPTGEAPAVLPTGPEPEDVDVKQFYVPSDALDACDAPGAEAAALAERLDSDSWTLACASLLIVRRLATHHPDHLAEVLDVVLPKVRHHMNSLRSSLCKTALIVLQTSSVPLATSCSSTSRPESLRCSPLC